MNGFWGADAEALRTMGMVCARRAELLDELEGRLSAVIDTVVDTGLKQHREITRLVTDRANPSSVAGALQAARENARGALEVVSAEMWECLNATYNGLAERERAARRLGPHEFLNYIKNRAAMFSGLTDSTLSRDEGYRFMLLGRSIERMDMAVRLLLSRAGDRASSPTWVTVLRATGAHDTYLRTHRGVLDAVGPEPEV